MIMESVSEDPIMFKVYNFLKPQEIKQLVEYANSFSARVSGAFYRSRVSHLDNNETISDTRTSYSCIIRYCLPEIFQNLQLRAAALTNSSVSCAESPEFIRYEVGQSFGLHYDSSRNWSDPLSRVWSVLIYVHVDEEETSGETEFPILKLKVKPVNGMALGTYCSSISWLFTQQSGRFLYKSCDCS